MKKSHNICIENKFSEYIYTKELNLIKSKSKSPSLATATDSPKSNDEKDFKNLRISKKHNESKNIFVPILNIEEANSDYIIYSAYDYEDETLSINITLNDESIYIKDGLSGGTFHQKIDNSKLIEGVNTIEIKVVDSSNKTTSRTIKITKEPMDLPKVGSEVVIDNVVYTVKSVLDNGDSYKVVLDRNVEKNNIMECELVDQPVNITAMIKQSESSTETKHNMKHISSIIKGDEAEDMYILEEDFRYITFKFEIGENEDNFVKKPKALFEYKED